MGSIGVSCTVDKRVSVVVEKAAKTEIFFNKEKINFPTVLYVIDKLTDSQVSVSIESTLPLGYGFSISGASALATALALNKLFNLQKSKFELAKVAHVAEIVNHTGLGSVATQITGGFLLKKQPGLPVSAIRLPFVGQKLYVVIIDRLLTPSVLENKKMVQRVNAVTDFYLQKLKDNKSLQLTDVLGVSFDFVTKTGLLIDERLIDIINRIKRSGGSATMAILGKVIITNTKPTFIRDYKTTELTITNDHL